jgi:hypothetical protein
MVGAHVRQFWSEIMQDVLLSSSLDIEEGSHSSVGGYTKATAYVKPTVGIDEEHIEEVPCRVDNLLQSSSVEPVKGMDIDLSLEKNVDIGINGMTIETEVGIKEIPVKEKQIPHEISDIIPPGNKDSSKVLLSHQLDADNDMVLDCRAKILLPAPNDVQGSNSFMKRGEEIDARACNSGNIPSPDSVSLVESCENKVMDVELSCGDTSAVPIRKYFIIMISLCLRVCGLGVLFFMNQRLCLMQKLVTSLFFFFSLSIINALHQCFCNSFHLFELRYY